MKNSCYALCCLLGTLSGSMLVVGAAIGQHPPVRPASAGPLGTLPYDDEYNCEIPSENPDTRLAPVVTGTGYDPVYDRAVWADNSLTRLGWGFQVVGYGPAESDAELSKNDDVAADVEGYGGFEGAKVVVASVPAEVDVMDVEGVVAGATGEAPTLGSVGKSEPISVVVAAEPSGSGPCLRGLAWSLKRCSDWMGAAADTVTGLANEFEGM